MFFRGQTIAIFLRFLWIGLIFGIIAIFFKLVAKISKKNLLVINITSFAYWLGFGLCFNLLCMHYYNNTFCWFGLLGMLAGMFVIKISIEFFFDYFVKLFYNKVILKIRERRKWKSLNKRKDLKI